MQNVSIIVIAIETLLYKGSCIEGWLKQLPFHKDTFPYIYFHFLILPLVDIELHFTQIIQHFSACTCSDASANFLNKRILKFTCYVLKQIRLLCINVQNLYVFRTLCELISSLVSSTTKPVRLQRENGSPSESYRSSCPNLRPSILLNDSVCEPVGRIFPISASIISTGVDKGG